MLGDILDVKAALKAVLDAPGFAGVVAEVRAEKLSRVPDVPDPFAARGATVYTEERLTKLIFPMCELLAHQTKYLVETMVKAGTHQIGMRWTVLEKDERTATMSVEVLASATVELFWNPLHAGLLSDVEINASPLIILEEDYAPLLPDSKGAFQKSALVVIQTTTYRD